MTPTKKQLLDADQHLYEMLGHMIQHPEDGYLSSEITYQDGKYGVFVMKLDTANTIRRITALYTNCPAFWDAVESAICPIHDVPGRRPH